MHESLPNAVGHFKITDWITRRSTMAERRRILHLIGELGLPEIGQKNSFKK